MARTGRSGVQFVGGAEFSPTMRKESSSFFDVAMGRKEVLAAKSVMDEVRRRVTQVRGGRTKAEREKEEKEKEEKLEKARAAAWAWYQHGKGGKESISSSSLSTSGGGGSTLAFRSDEVGLKSSRFKTEALKTTSGYNNSITAPADLQGGQHRRAESTGHNGRAVSGRSWDLSNLSMSRTTSSLFDSYELDSVSKRIDNAFHGNAPSLSTQKSGLAAAAMAAHPGFNNSSSTFVHQGEGPSVKGPTGGLPPPTRPPGASAPCVPQVVTIPHNATLQVLPSSPKITRSSSLRGVPRCICSSISDVVTHEEMSLGVDIANCDCHKTGAAAANQNDGSGWSLRRVTRAIQEFIHLPDSEYHPQQQHHERRHARLHLHHHHHHHHQHQHDHEYHHHLHYQVKLRDGVHHGNSFSAHPGQPNPSDLEVLKENDHLSFPRPSPKSPKVSPKLFSLKSELTVHQ